MPDNLTDAQKSLSLDVLGLLQTFISNDPVGYECLMDQFADNGELVSVINTLAAHYLALANIYGKQNGLTVGQVVASCQRSLSVRR